MRWRAGKRGFTTMTEALLRHSADAVVLGTLDGAILRANPSACAAFGRSEEELRELGRDRVLVRDERAERMMAERDRRSTARGEVLLRRRNGTTFPAEATVTVIAVRGREPVELVIFRDRSEERRVERELREGEALFHALADHIAQLAWMADARGALVWFNARWYEYTGTTLEQVRGRGWQRLLHPDHRDRVLGKARACVRAGEPWEETFPLRARDGSHRWFLCRAMPIRDARGRVLRWFGTNTDVTAQREAQEALHESDARKTNFLAVLSHELRNPLAAIQNGLCLIERAPGTPLATRAAQIARRQVDHITSLVDDLLDLSRITHDKIALQRGRLDAREVVRRAAEAARPAFDARGVALRLGLPSEPLWMDADATRVTQVVANLLGNALKFTSPGGAVEVEAARNAAAAELRVRDSGAGIEPHLLEKIFEPFAQAERTRATAGGGMGIGLALVKRFVAMHEGSVRALSEGRGKGAEFIVSLPLACGAGEGRDTDTDSDSAALPSPPVPLAAERSVP